MASTHPARTTRDRMILRVRVLGFVAALLPLPALAAYPAPTLSFTPDQMALARSVASDAGLSAWYSTRNLQPIFVGAEAAARRAALIAAVETAPRHGLPLGRYNLDALRRLDAQGGTDPRTEAIFVHSFAAWTHDVGGGVLNPRRLDPGNQRTVLRKPAAELLNAFASSADPEAVLASVAPTDARYAALKEALAAETGGGLITGLPPVPVRTWREGDSGDGVAALRARLNAAGFAAAPAGDPLVMDAALASAVARFQDRAGLPSDGVAGPRTLERLNGGAGPRVRALMIALERMRWLAGHDPNARQVWVNLPEYVARIRDGGQTVFQTRVVIGKNEGSYRTPEFSDEMEHVVVNPRWNVPRSITVKEYLPKLKANRNAASQLDIVDSKGRVVSRDSIDFSRYTESNFPYRMRQKPSDDNALGQVKFIFPNSMNIYLHDTPSKGLFNESRRAFSHGCIRVGRPVELAEALLTGQTKDPAATYSRALKTGKETWLKLDPKIPVHLVYLTTYIDDDGRIRSVPDVYGRDAAVWAGLEKAGARAAGDGLETVALAE